MADVVSAIGTAADLSDQPTQASLISLAQLAQKRRQDESMRQLPLGSVSWSQSDLWKARAKVVQLAASGELKRRDSSFVSFRELEAAFTPEEAERRWKLQLDAWVEQLLRKEAA
ncbi:MAG: hypothetical protein AAGJ19_13845 [Myxococcota bacterium]